MILEIPKTIGSSLSQSWEFKWYIPASPWKLIPYVLIDNKAGIIDDLYFLNLFYSFQIEDINKKKQYWNNNKKGYCRF